MNKTTLLVLEIAWITIAIVCLVAAVHNRVTAEGNRFFIFMGMSVIAGFMAYLRDRQRRKS